MHTEGGCQMVSQI